MRAISIRIEDDLGKQFDEVCKKAGYKKNTLLTRLIASFVKYQKRGGSVRQNKSKDPFLEVIGLMNIHPLLNSSEDIDKIVYGL